MEKESKRANEEHWKVLVTLLREIAKDKGITNEQIASESGLMASNVSRFFALKYKPTLDTFLLVAGAIKVNFFFEDRESKSNLNNAMERAMERIGRRKMSNNLN